MAKAKTVYSCTECGATSSKWQGQCPGCGVWNTLVETVAETSVTSNKRFAAIAGTSVLQTLSEIEAREEDRLPTGIGEFDRALGGGLVAARQRLTQIAQRTPDQQSRQHQQHDREVQLVALHIQLAKA